MRQDVRLGLILQQLNESGSVGVAELAAQLDVSEASVRRDLHRLEQQNLLTRTHGGAVASGVLYELPDALPRGTAPRREARDRGSGRRPGDAGDHVGRPQRRYDDHRGGPGAVRSTRPAGRHQRAQHRLRARGPLQHRAGRLRWQRPGRVLRAGRPTGRADPRPPQPRPGVHRRRRDQPDRRPDHPPRGRGPDQPRPGPHRSPGRGRGRLEQARSPGVRQDRRPRRWSPT